MGVDTLENRAVFAAFPAADPPGRSGRPSDVAGAARGPC